MDYDVVVIGAGPGGYVAAIRCGQLGLRTAIVEEQFLGGVCLNIGCIPSKAIIKAAKEFKEAKGGAEKGLMHKESRVDMPRLVAYKDGVVKRLTGGVGQLLKANKVDVLEGRGTLLDANTVRVRGATTTTLKTKNVLLATGSRTIEIPGFKFDEKRIVSSTGALALTQVPGRLVIIGGGVIGLELGCALSNLGTKEVTVIEMMDQLLPGVDKDIANGLTRLLKKRGWKIHLGARAKEAVAGKGVTVNFEVEQKAEKVEADVVLVSVGRRPNTEELGLEKAGVERDARGFIPTDEHMQTNTPGVYAIGDITSGPMLAHKASREGLVAAATMAGQKGMVRDFIVPGVIFTDPEVATAGLTEAEAKAKGLKVRTGTFPLAALGKALADGATDGFYKIVAEEGSDRLLGVHLFGPHASDLIAEAVLALEAGLTVEDLSLTVHPHPTLSEGIMEAAEALHGKAIHTMNRA